MCGCVGGRIAKPDVGLQPARQFRMASYPLPGSGLLANQESVAATVTGHGPAQPGRQMSGVVVVLV